MAKEVGRAISLFTDYGRIAGYPDVARNTSYAVQSCELDEEFKLR